MMGNSCKRDGATEWPPWTVRHTNRRARAWFFRRLAFGVFALFLITISSMSAAAWLIAGRIGPADAAAALGLLVLLFGIGAVAVATFGGMRRIASPLHAVMDAADRVAEGDYGVRVQDTARRRCVRLRTRSTR